MNPRVGPIAGVLAVVLTIVSIILTGDGSPDFIDEPSQITAYYADDPGKLIGGFIAHALATALLVVFVSGLYVRLGGVRRGTLPPASFGGGIAMCGLFMLYEMVNLAAAFRADEDGQIATETATALNDLGFLVLGVGATMFAAVFVGCAAFSALASGALPRWLAYVSVPLALGLLIAPIAYLFLIVLLVWILLVSVLMWLEPAGAAAPA